MRRRGVPLLTSLEAWRAMADRLYPYPEPSPWRRLLDLVAGSTAAGLGLWATVTGTGAWALGGLVVFVIVETAIVLHLLGFEPGDFR
jgi:hypothetical protein